MKIIFARKEMRKFIESACVLREIRETSMSAFETRRALAPTVHTIITAGHMMSPSGEFSRIIVKCVPPH